MTTPGVFLALLGLFLLATTFLWASQIPVAR